MIDTYSSLGHRFSKMLENEEKCRQFSQYLRKNIQVENDMDNVFTIIDQSALISVQIQQKCFQNTQVQKNMNKQNMMELKSHNQLHKMKTLKKKNSGLKNHQIQEENEFMDDQQRTQQNQFEQITLDNHESNTPSGFGESNFQNKNQNLSDKNQTNQENDVQDEYFQLTILDETAPSEDQNHQKQHHVKIYASNNQNPNQHQHNDAFNLSNFSSFNGVNSNQSTQSPNSIPQSKFYEQEFMYLVKKIEMVQGRKLSQKGIQKIALQLQSLLPQNPLSQISFNKVQIQVSTEPGKLKIVPKLNFTKKSKLQNSEKLNCDFNAQKRVKYQTNIQSELKSKSKPKNTNPKPIQKPKHQSNKQNVKLDFESQKHKLKKDTDRSTSPLSYKILMEKKKTQKQKSQERKNKIQSAKTVQKQPSEDHNLSSNLSNQSFYKKTNQMKIGKCFQSEKQPKQSINLQNKNRLKIILQSTSQKKMKTLSFEYSSTGLNLQKEVQDYCMKNKIQSQNVKPICQALSQQKPIITIKQ